MQELPGILKENHPAWGFWGIFWGKTAIGARFGALKCTHLFCGENFYLIEIMVDY
ncbi:hypothetical protein PYR66_12985 [Klebsiella aerogenes]|nr:hypothetical protein PYR66_12985 [Klebsiella aerogenes]